MRCGSGLSAGFVLGSWLLCAGAARADVYCSYEGRSHDVLSSSFRSIGITLCRTHLSSGSDRHAAISWALDHYNDVARCEVYLYIAGWADHTDYGDTLKEDDVNKLDIGLAGCSGDDCSYSGRTLTRTNDAGYINEFDIHFNKDVSWDFGEPSSYASTSVTYFRSVLLHELGHGLGFDHTASLTADLSIMGSGCGKFLENLQIGLKAYDYGHLRHHYPDTVESSLADLVLSNYRTNLNSASNYECDLNDGLSVTTVSPGGSLTLTWTRMNLGDRDVVNSYTTKVYLSTDTTLSGDDTLVKTWIHTGSVTEHSTKYCSTTLTVPSTMRSGTYYVIMKIDSASDVAERSNTNNDMWIHEQLAVR